MKLISISISLVMFLFLSSCAPTRRSVSEILETDVFKINNDEHDLFQPDMIHYHSSHLTVIDPDVSTGEDKDAGSLTLRIGYMQQTTKQMWYVKMHRIAYDFMYMNTLEFLVNETPTKLYAEPDAARIPVSGVFFEVTEFELPNPLITSFHEADSVRIRLTGSDGRMEASLTNYAIACIDSFVVYVTNVLDKD
jgi:hypothetical protein